MNDEHLNREIELYGDGIGKVQLIQHMGSDATIVRSARVSFGNDSGGESEDLSEKDRKLIKYLIEHRHTSTLEHNSITLKFTVPLPVRSQHHRHRTWSYNEISRRYTDENFQFYEPKEFRTQHESNRQASNENDLKDPFLTHSRGGYGNAANQMKWHHAESLKLYNDLLKNGVCREQARGVLPQNMYTQYYGTVNLSNLLKFIELRTHEGAQWEIQQVARACLTIAEELWPITIAAYKEIRGLK